MPVKTKSKVSPLRTLKPSLRKKRSSLFPESRVQKAGLEWLKYFNPEVRKRVVKIHNEGARSAASTSLLISLGLRPGASDLLIAWPTNKYAGLWLEVKRENWKDIPSQRVHFARQLEFGQLMIDSGYHFDVAVGLDKFILIVTRYLSET